MLKQGSLLESTSLLDSTDFEKATIYISEYNAGGATGFIINQLFPHRLNELEEFSHARPLRLYKGGPVETEKIFMLHRQPQLVTGGNFITPNLFAGGDLHAAVEAINNGRIPESDIKLFVGYCGWDAGQLEAEIGDGSFRLLNQDGFELFGD